jgi:hypothetical protein
VDSSYPIVPSEEGPVRQRKGGQLAQPSAAPIHEAGAMSLETGDPLRQECWDAMGASIRQRLLGRAGTLIDWWAQRDDSAEDGRAEAVVFGDRGLFIAEPRVNTEHRPVYALKGFHLDAASLRRVAIDHRPSAGNTTAATAYGAVDTSSDLGLSAAARGLLGNLPPRAQELLQAPFTRQPVVRCDWHYEGYEHRLTMFMVYLAGARDVTVATGTKVIPAGHGPRSAHWDLTCFRASVVRRVGI